MMTLCYALLCQLWQLLSSVLFSDSAVQNWPQPHLGNIPQPNGCLATCTGYIGMYTCQSKHTHWFTEIDANTHTLVKVTMLHETKGQMVDNGTVPALARWLKICISVHTCTWMNPYRSLCSRFTAVCQISACFNAGESTSISSVNSLSKAKSWNCWSKSDRPFSICSG